MQCLSRPVPFIAEPPPISIVQVQRDLPLRTARPPDPRARHTPDHRLWGERGPRRRLRSQRPEAQMHRVPPPRREPADDRLHAQGGRGGRDRRRLLLAGSAARGGRCRVGSEGVSDGSMGGLLCCELTDTGMAQRNGPCV